MENPKRARARRTDPDTSHAAARKQRNLTEAQQAVMTVFRAHDKPLLDEELIPFYSLMRAPFRLPIQTASGIRSRRVELQRAGKLVVVDKARMSTGSMGQRFKAAD